MATGRAPRVGFVLEQSLGHVTHADNLRSIIGDGAAIDAAWLPVAYDVTGPAARVPLFGSNWTVRAGVRARRAIRSAHAAAPLDALFVHTQVPAVLTADWLRRVPGVVSLDATPLQYDGLGAHYDHHAGGPRVERAKWRAQRASLRHARAVVAWSRWTARSLVDDYGVPAEKVVVIPPGVHYSAWAHRPAATTGGPVRVLFVGGHLVRKGGDVLLEAVRQLRAEHADDPSRTPEVTLDLVTQSPVPAEPGVRVHAGLRPNSAELKALYHRADVFCLPTRGDCLPMVLSEAGAASLPLVSTDVGAIAEIVRDGETGALVPPGDARALAAALGALARDPDRRRRLGEGAAALVRRDFDAERNAGALVELLRATAGAGAPGGRPC